MLASPEMILDDVKPSSSGSRVQFGADLVHQIGFDCNDEEGDLLCRGRYQP